MSALASSVAYEPQTAGRRRFRIFWLEREEIALRASCDRACWQFRLASKFLADIESFMIRRGTDTLMLSELRPLLRGTDGHACTYKALRPYLSVWADAGLTVVSDHWRLSDRTFTILSLNERCEHGGVTLAERHQAKLDRTNARRRVRYAERKVEAPQALRINELEPGLPNWDSQNDNSEPTESEFDDSDFVVDLIQTLKAQSRSAASPGASGLIGVPAQTGASTQAPPPNTSAQPTDAPKGVVDQALGDLDSENEAFILNFDPRAVAPNRHSSSLLPTPVMATRPGKAVTRAQMKQLNAAFSLSLRWHHVRRMNAPWALWHDAIKGAKKKQEQEIDAGGLGFENLEGAIFNGAKMRAWKIWGPRKKGQRLQKGSRLRPLAPARAN